MQQNITKYTLGVVYQIWNDAGDYHIDIGPDIDCPELTIIREVDSEGIGANITFNNEQLKILQQIIGLRLKENTTQD